MNKYIIRCISDCQESYAVAYAESFNDDMLNLAADEHSFNLAVGIVPDSFIVQSEGYDYYNMTEEAIRAVVDNIDWEGYYNYDIQLFEGTDEEFNTYPLIYDGRNKEITSGSGWAEEQDSAN